MDTTQIIVWLGGQGVIVVGLCAWLGKIWSDRIARKEQADIQRKLATLKTEFDGKLASMNSGNESKVHVSKIQYEKEYENYTEIWELTSPISHQIQTLFAHKQSFELYKTAYFDLGNYKVKLGAKVNELYPFIDGNVYTCISKCPQILQNNWGVFEQHLHYLEEKANHEHLPSIDIESDFGKLIDGVTAEFHNLSIEVAKAIRSRNEQMIVLNNAI